MKKIIFIIINFIICSLPGRSQLDKKTWLIGGTVSYSHAKYNTGVYNSMQEQYEFNISPLAGYFFTDKLACGIITSINGIGAKAQGTTIWNKYSNINLGPFARYYLLKKEKVVNILAGGYYQLGAEGSSNGLNKKTLAFLAGPVLYFNSSVGLELLVSHLTYWYKNVNASDNKIQFSLGLQIHLQKDN
jgi:hypothetical protein